MSPTKIYSSFVPDQNRNQFYLEVKLATVYRTNTSSMHFEILRLRDIVQKQYSHFCRREVHNANCCYACLTNNTTRTNGLQSTHVQSTIETSRTEYYRNRVGVGAKTTETNDEDRRGENIVRVGEIKKREWHRSLQQAFFGDIQSHLVIHINNS